jgi:hypothetical protein
VVVRIVTGRALDGFERFAVTSTRLLAPLALPTMLALPALLIPPVPPLVINFGALHVPAADPRRSYLSEFPYLAEAPLSPVLLIAQYL